MDNQVHRIGLPAVLAEGELDEMIRLYHFQPQDRELLQELAEELCLCCRAEAFFMLLPLAQAQEEEIHPVREPEPGILQDREQEEKLLVHPVREPEPGILQDRGQEEKLLVHPVREPEPGILQDREQEEKLLVHPVRKPEPEILPTPGAQAEVLLTLGAGTDAWLEETGRNGDLLRSYGADCLTSCLLRRAYESFDRFFSKQTGKWIREYRFYGEQLPLEGLREAFAKLPQEVISLNEKYLMRPARSVAFRALLSETPVRRLPLCAGCSGNCGEGVCRTGVRQQTGQPGVRQTAKGPTDRVVSR